MCWPSQGPSNQCKFFLYSFIKIFKHSTYKQRSHFSFCLEKWEPIHSFWEFRVRTLQKQCPDVLKNSVCSFLLGRSGGRNKGWERHFIKNWKAYWFSLARTLACPLPTNHTAVPEVGPSRYPTQEAAAGSAWLTSAAGLSLGAFSTFQNVLSGKWFHQVVMKWAGRL